MMRVMGVDDVVASHYRGLNVARLEQKQLHASTFRYISFRRRDKIFWTRDAKKLPAGEEILSDGNLTLRARCGNQISEVPMLPVLPTSEDEPNESDFEDALPADLAPTPLAFTSLEHESRRSALEVKPRGAELEPSGAVGVPLVATTGFARGFQGWNVLASGSGLPPPSENLALSDAAAINFSWGGAIPAPVQPSPVSPGLTVSEGVWAIVGEVATADRRTVTAPARTEVTVSFTITDSSTPASQTPVIYNPYESVSSKDGMRPAPGSTVVELWTGPRGSTVNSDWNLVNLTGRGDFTTGPLLTDGQSQQDVSTPEPASAILLTSAFIMVINLRGHSSGLGKQT